MVTWSRRRWLLVLLAGLLLILLLVGLIWLLREQLATTQTEETGSGGRGTVSATPRQGGLPGSPAAGPAAQSDWYQLYFTNPIYPANPAQQRGGLDERLVDLMNQSRRSLDVAIYDFDLANLADAMTRAQQRGVQVRMVTDTDTLNNKNAEIQTALNRVKQAGIPIVDDNRGAIMHHKFTVVDREWVSTGSWNYTFGDTYRLNNHMIVIRSRELAENYAVEFEKMFVKRQFGPTKDRAVPNPTLTITGTSVRTCFAPETRCAQPIIDAIAGARQEVTFLAFSFTHDEIGEAMLARSRAGVTVRGVYETSGSQTRFSEYTRMKDAGLEVYTDGNPWVMHHKVIVIDNRIVVFGSFNFSDNAERSNDENLLIVENSDLASAFQQEFLRVREVARNPPAR